MKTKVLLTNSERLAMRRVLKIADFDKALHATPASIWDKMFALLNSGGEHDFYDEDVFPDEIVSCPARKEKTRTRRRPIEK